MTAASTPEEKIHAASISLRKPAGEAPEFASPALIAQNREAFVLRCHATWKQWHLEAIKQIFFFEGWLRREKTNPIGQGAGEWGTYNQAVWRRISDAIVWALFAGQRHIVKRLCLYRGRGSLLESNPDSAMAAIAAINANPLSLAIWNDATSCIDIGDLTYIKDGRTPVPQFIELKGGKVNAEIVELLKLDGAEFDAKFREFSEVRSKKGVAQFNRVRRQQKTNSLAMNLLENERGEDPITGREMRVVELPIAPEDYDSELNAVLVNALDKRGEVMQLVSECLWVYANADPEVHRGAAVQRFQVLLSERLTHEHVARLATLPAWDRDRLVPLSAGFSQPMVRPIFIRSLNPRAIAAATYGDLMFKVLFYFDWERFGNVLADCGAQLRWASDKQARQRRAVQSELRPPLIGGRLPQVEVYGETMMVSDPNLVELLFDGLTPRTVAKGIVAHAALLKAERGS